MSSTLQFNGFELRGFNAFLAPRALDALEERDALQFMILVDNERGLELVDRNRGALQSRGIYEAALVHALVGCRTNNHGRYPLIGKLLHYADKKRLKAAVYRGVAGKGAARRVRGYSWTADPDRARWFAERLPLHAPAVVRAVVPTPHILFCSNDRSESEFFVELPASFPAERVAAAEGDGE